MIEYKVLKSDIGISNFGLIYSKGGSREEDKAKGTSHLMEHLMCKTFDDLRPKMRELGIDYNACTGDNRVLFWWEGLDTELSILKDTLIDRIMFPEKEIEWSKEDFENEKSTVLQEYADCFNDQFQGTYYNTLRKFYNYTAAIGLRADIENFSYEDSLVQREKFLIPNTIFEVGHQSEQIQHIIITADSIIKNPLIDLQFGSYNLPIEYVPKEDKSIVGLVSKVPMNKADMAIGDFLCDCITSGLESPLYQEIREKRGLSYYSIGWSILVGDKFVQFFASSTTNDKVKELAEVYHNFFSARPEDTLSKERFETCKASMLIKEKKDRVLPHEGIHKLMLSDVNPYTDIHDLSYESALERYSVLFDVNKLQSVEY